MAKGSQGQKTRGRPALPIGRGKRHAVGIRTTKEIKDLLQRAANSSGRSVAQEIEFRLERSFDRQGLLGEGLILAYGREAGDMIRIMAREFARNGRIGAQIARGEPPKPSDDWLDNAFGYDQGARAVICLLERLRPPGDPKLPTTDAATAQALEQRAARSVEITLSAIKDPSWGEQFAEKDRNRELEELAAEVRPTLAARIDRSAA